MPNYTRLVHFYMLITLKHKAVEKFVKKAYMVKNTHLIYGHLLWMHIEIARQFQCVPTTYVTEIKETYFEISMPIIALQLKTSQSAYQY